MVAAAPVDGLYSVQLPVEDESSQVRQDAFTRGLEEVMIRIAGDSIVLEKVDRPPVNRYVSQYSYQPLEKPKTGPEGETYNHIISIRYNGKLIEQYLREKGMPVWGEHRFNVVIWLVVNDGRNRYILKDADKSLVKNAVQTAMNRRGIPAKWPVFDTTDRGRINIADIRGGFDQALKFASERYTNGPILAVSLDWNGKSWQSTWNLLLQTENHHWSLENGDYGWLIDRGVDRAADAIGAVYAISDVAGEDELATVYLDVLAVNNIAGFRKAENYLASLRAVHTIVPVQVEQGHVLFKVLLRSSVENFINILKSGSDMVEVEKELPEPLSIVPEIVPETQPPVPETKPDDTSSQTAADSVQPAIEAKAELKADYQFRLMQ